jgi:TolB-like protein
VEPILYFGRWRVIPGSRRLLAGDVHVPLGNRAFDLLLALLDARGAVVTKDELLRRVWSNVVVDEANLQVQVSMLRKVLGDDGQRMIVTIPGHGYRFDQAIREEGARLQGAITPTPRSSRPMLAVLPFTNMTGDPGQAYFADGITADLITALSHFRWFSVISRNSAFTYKDRAVDVRVVGRELGVGYVLEGSVRVAGGQVRIAVQLCETEMGGDIWADRFDGELADIFALQDRLTDAVAGAIVPNLHRAEVQRGRARPTESLTAYDLYLRALPYRFARRHDNDEAMRLLRRAIELDPDFAVAKGALAGQLVLRATQGWASAAEIEEAIRCARDLVREGGADDPTSLAWAAHAMTFLGRDYEAGAAAADRAVMLAPNSGFCLYLGAWNRLYVNDWQTAVMWTERAMRLSPVDPEMAFFTTCLGASHFAGERYEEAVSWVRRAITENGDYLVPYRLLATSLALLGRLHEARAVLPAMLAVAPGYTLTKAAAHTAFRGNVRERYLEGLRRAGLPE